MSSNDVPFYLMPVAAVLGMYAVAGSLRTCYLAYCKFVKKKDVPSRYFGVLVGTVLVSTLLYAKVVASVNNAMESSDHALFDPYELLELPSSTTNSTIIKQAYRTLSKRHHPDKGGSPDLFQKIHQAYKALTDEVGMRNYRQYGHPDGPPSHTSLEFALPTWLLHPEGNIALVLVLLYLGMFVGIAVVALRMVAVGDVVKKQLQDEEEENRSDLAYIASHLTPDTTHLDLLYMIATAPQSIKKTQARLDRREILVIQNEEKVVEQEKKKEISGQFDFGDGEWADDHQDENEQEAAAKEKQLLAAKEKQQEQLNAAQGKSTAVKLEGVHEGVIGQAWVQGLLEKEKKWPLESLGWLEGKTFAYRGEQVAAMDHPAVYRNVLMTTGRMHSIHLNSQTELLEAGSKGLVDQTYFRPTVEYRQRTMTLLDAALKVAIVMGSYPLAKTIIETMQMFKVGTWDPLAQDRMDWFRGVTKKQYGTVPSLEIDDLVVHTDDEDEIATNDTCTVEMSVTRVHAEDFTKQKIAQCKKQGIPPQLGLQTYREGWWFLVRAEKLDDGQVPATSALPNVGIPPWMRKVLDNIDLDKFSEETQEQHLLKGWPMMVENVAQKSGKIKVKFTAPSEPGKYRFHIAIKSIDFIGCDLELTCEREIVDEALLEDRDEQDDDDGEEEEEPKKDK